jgi:hypothetical protein
MGLRTSALLLLSTALLTGCATFEDDVQRGYQQTNGWATPTPAKMSTTYTTADVRIIYQRQHPLDPSRQVVCTEPSPDVAKALSTAFSTNAAGGNATTNASLAFSGGSAEAVQALAGRSTALLGLRDGLFQACQAYANGAIGDDAYALILSRYGQLMTTLFLGQDVTGAAGTESGVKIDSSGLISITSGNSTTTNNGGGAAAESKKSTTGSSTTTSQGSSSSQSGSAAPAASTQTLADATAMPSADGSPANKDALQVATTSGNNPATGSDTDTTTIADAKDTKTTADTKPGADTKTGTDTTQTGGGVTTTTSTTTTTTTTPTATPSTADKKPDAPKQATTPPAKTTTPTQNATGDDSTKTANDNAAMLRQMNKDYLDIDKNFIPTVLTACVNEFDLTRADYKSIQQHNAWLLDTCTKLTDAIAGGAIKMFASAKSVDDYIRIMAALNGDTSPPASTTTDKTQPKKP